MIRPTGWNARAAGGSVATVPHRRSTAQHEPYSASRNFRGAATFYQDALSAEQATWEGSMTNRANRTLMVSAALTFALTATALAAGPLKGRTYEGGVPTSGTSSEGHNRLTLHAGGTISLRVSGNGSTVTVHFSSASPVLYCNTQKKLQVQKQPKPARISASGSF